MKTYNKELLEATKLMSGRTYQRAMSDAYKATHPTLEVLRGGAMISSCIGLSLMAAGFAGLALKKWTPAFGALISGAVVAVVNLSNATKK